MPAPPFWVVTTNERSVFEASAPTADRIDAAFRNAVTPESARLGTWVGPTPRVTRQARPPYFYTYATWIWAWNEAAQRLPDAAFDVVARGFAQRLFDNLRGVSAAFEPPQFGPYNEATHGPLAAWQDGTAAQTRTRLEFPTLAGRLDPIENPVGPTGRGPSTVGEIVQRTTTGIVRTAVPLLLVAAGGVALYLVVDRLVLAPRRA